MERNCLLFSAAICMGKPRQWRRTLLAVGVMASISASAAQSAPKDVVVVGSSPAVQASALGGGVDYVNAKPMPLPTISFLPTKESSAEPVIYPGAPGYSKGGGGDGKESPKTLVPADQLRNAADAASSADSGVAPSEFGTQNLPFTTSRVDVRMGTAAALQASKYDYYRRAGKLFFKIGSVPYVCSASLIKPGVVVTAAHCVADYGKKQFHTNFQYVPAYYNGTAPYGIWVGTPMLMASYYNGTDSCAVSGVVCRNDVAVIKLVPQSGKYAGNSTGWYGYGWNGYSFTGANTNPPPANVVAMITQLGYPGSHDSGLEMQRTDAEGYVSGANAYNTVIGSRQTAGASGGPWLVNFGEVAALSGAAVGAEASSNIVVGATSWGYTSDAPKAQGASPFTSTNIVPLVAAACPTATTAGCF